MKLGFTSYAFRLKNIDYGYSSDPLYQCVSNEYQQCIFGANLRRLSQIISCKMTFIEPTKAWLYEFHFAASNL